VEITSLEISVVGVAGGRDATDAFRRRAKEGEDENTEYIYLRPTYLVAPEGPRGPGHNIGAG
jgi:hypothetical protein